MPTPITIVMIGATGAVGSHAAATLAAMPEVERLTLLGRRPLDSVEEPKVHQRVVDIFDPDSYRDALPGHGVAICTLGVGQPSKISREDFVKIDRDAVLSFARECKAAGVSHFELLSSIGASSKSRSFFLRTKGELEDGLRALQFDRLSLFHPSMILTPKNRYGLQQAFVLQIWPLLTPLLAGGLRKFRGVRVERLGQAIAQRAGQPGKAVEILCWGDFHAS